MKKLNLSGMFTIAAILLTFSGMSFAVPSIKSAYGVTDISTYYVFLIVGTTQLVSGIVAWLVRKDPASKTLTTLAYGYASVFILWAIVNVIGTTGDFRSISGHDNSLWRWAVIFSLFALGFFITGKAGKLNGGN
jgi:cation transport ATPase